MTGVQTCALPICSEHAVTGLAITSDDGDQWIVQLSPRSSWDYLSIYYRRHQVWVISGLFALGVGLVLSLLFGRRLSTRNTQLAQTHAALKAAQAAIIDQEKYRQAKDIAGGFAHEIRNALFPAVTAFDRIRRLLAAPNPESPRLIELTDSAGRAVRRAIDLTKLVSQFTRLGDQSVPGQSAVRKVVDDILAANDSRIAPLGVSVRTDGDPGMAVALPDTYLYMVLNNLVLNSLDALDGRPNPCLTISWKPSDPTPEAADSLPQRQRPIIIMVEDNGCGIPESDQPRIFDTFFSTKPSTGTGLGLATVLKVVTMYGGEMSFSSTPGIGTSFKLLLPQAE